MGKIRERYLTQGIAEYGRRLQKYGRFEIVEIKETSYRASLGEKERQLVLEGEGARIMARLASGAYVIALDRCGVQWSSEQLADRFRTLAVSGINRIDFIIGGSLGLSPKVLQRAGVVWSFSKLTFPHQLMRLMLAEQIYRARTIGGGESYHK